MWIATWITDHPSPPTPPPPFVQLEKRSLAGRADRAGKAGVYSIAILDWHRQKLHLAENAEPEEQSAV